MKKSKLVGLDVDEIVEEYADMVYRIAFVQMKNQSDAEDIFQEVFLRLVKYSHTIKGEEHIKPWLIRVTINCCKKQFDSAWRKKTTSMDEEQMPEQADERASAAFAIGDNEELLDACLSLPEAQQLVIHLFYFEGYSIREISTLVEQSESSVKTRLSRAREALRKKMKGDF
ncbi:RNA polymerase sigma factor [Candidatus Enterococcus mansonii]